MGEKEPAQPVESASGPRGSGHPDGGPDPVAGGGTRRGTWPVPYAPRSAGSRSRGASRGATSRASRSTEREGATPSVHPARAALPTKLVGRLARRRPPLCLGSSHPPARMLPLPCRSQPPCCYSTSATAASPSRAASSGSFVLPTCFFRASFGAQSPGLWSNPSECGGSREPPSLFWARGMAPSGRCSCDHGLGIAIETHGGMR
jgi:hypothetical protein